MSQGYFTHTLTKFRSDVHEFTGEVFGRFLRDLGLNPNYYDKTAVFQIRFGSDQDVLTNFSLAGIDLDLTVEGQDLDTTKFGLQRRPQSLVSLEYTRTMGGANKATVVLLDHTFGELEKLIQDYRDDVNISYGYAGGYTTPWLRLGVLDYTPVIKTEGIEVTLELLSGLSDSEQKRNRSYRGNISDIIKYIANGNGWKLVIEDTIEIPSTSLLESSRMGLAQFFQNGVSDINFIRDVLLPSAASKNGNIGSFYAWFNDHDRTFNFKTPDWISPPVRQYPYMYASRNSIVTEWNPQFKGKMLSLLGDGEITVRTYDKETGSYVEQTYNRNNSPLPFGQGYGNFWDFVEGQTKQIVADSLFNFTGVSLNGYHATVLGKQRFEHMRANTLQAEMEVLGDPELAVNTNIEVTVILPNGDEHYSGGRWHVFTAMDKINAGDFKTQLTLKRYGLEDGVAVGGREETEEEGNSVPLHVEDTGDTNVTDE